MDAAGVGITQEEDGERGVDQEDVFHRVVFFLAAITRGLFSSILGADDAPFGPVMGKRGAAGAAPAASGMTSGAASTTATPSRCARAMRERAGVSPRLRRAAYNADKST